MAITRQGPIEELLSLINEAIRKLFHRGSVRKDKKKDVPIEDVTGFFNPQNEIKDINTCYIRPFQNIPSL